MFKGYIRIAANRSLPTFTKRASKLLKRWSVPVSEAKIALYIDEFTEFQDAGIGEAAARFFKKINIPFHVVYAPSARASMSKAMLEEAQKQVRLLVKKLEIKLPVVGLEPSAVLGLRDDLSKLFRGEERTRIEKLGQRAFTFEEYIAKLVDDGLLNQEHFTKNTRKILVHIHCHQKAISHPSHTLRILNLPENYSAEKIPSGCCGMAGSFGYEQEHFELSMKIGEQVLFPRIRKMEEGVILSAAGTSCRHQIKDGVGKNSYHPAEILLDALL